MGVISMKMYGSINDGKSHFSTATAQNIHHNTETAIIAARRRHFSHRSCSPKNKLLDEHQHRTSSHHASEGRPPRHPDSKISKYEESNAPAVYIRDLDIFRNEKFPTESIARFERENDKISEESNVLTNEAFRLLLGLEELNDDIIVLGESEIHERESIA